MKKLKIKLFVTIFSILTVFLLIVIFVSGYRFYNEQRQSIIDILSKEHVNLKNIRVKPDDMDNLELEDNNLKKIFVNYSVYTVILDNTGSYGKLINHTESSEDEENIMSVANDIINNHNNSFYISNLLFEDYSYSFNNNVLTIVDNSLQTNNISKYLITLFVIFILLETVIYFLSNMITKWISEPVLESFEREKRFVADASHELKTPIAVIMANADAYYNDKDVKWIDNIKSESERMTKLVTGLLDLAKLENDKEVVKKEINLSNIILGSVLTFESMFFEQKLKLDYKIDDNIMFNCNEDEIRELMSILIDNAIKHSVSKGKVIIKLYKNNKDIVLEVSNKGDAIKEEDREKIFERFYKVDSSRNRKSNNYGLGLSIAKRIVELHDGKISVNCKDGCTTFKIIWS